MTAKITTNDYDALTALAVIDQTNSAEQIRLALSFYFTRRMQDQAALSKKIDAARERHEAALSVISGQNALAQGQSNEPTNKPVEARLLEKSVTLRVDGHTLDLLTAFSLVDEKTLAEVMRAAIDGYLQHRRSDPHLARQLDAAKRQYERTLSALANSSG